jgi:hypothetical protein
MALRLIDLDTPRPNNHRGDPTRTANGITNENMQAIDQRLGALEGGTPAIDTRLDALDDAVEELGDSMGAVGDSLAQESLARAAADLQLQQAISAAVAGTEVVAGRIVGRNRFINGDLRIWQRRTSGRVGAGAGTLGSEAFCADRFTFSALNCTHDASRGVVGSGGTTLPPQTTYALIHNVSGASATSAAWGGQRIEGVRSLQGKVTFSIELSGTVGNKVGIRVIQNFGTGGAPSAEVSTIAGVLTCGANPERKWLTFDIPSTAGKTLGTNGNDFLYFVYDMCGAGYSGQISAQNGAYAFSDFQIEIGDLATNFEFRPYPLELLFCQRYYEIVPMGGISGVTYTANGDTRGALVNYKVPKRGTPSITRTGTLDVIATGSASDVANVNLGTVSLNGDTNRVFVSSISNFVGLAGVGGVAIWGDNRSQLLTALIDAEF